jgi:hypothetical protein
VSDYNGNDPANHLPAPVQENVRRREQLASGAEEVYDDLGMIRSTLEEVFAKLDHHPEWLDEGDPQRPESEWELARAVQQVPMWLRRAADDLRSLASVLEDAADAGRPDEGPAEQDPS